MVAHHYISKLLIDERVSELRNASGGGRPEKPPSTGPRRRRHQRQRRFALGRRRAIKPTPSSPS